MSIREDMQRQIFVLTARLKDLETQETGGVQPFDDTNVSTPPTDLQLTNIFGTAANAGAGYLALLDDNAGGTNLYLIGSDGTNWHQLLMTKAV